MIMVREKGMTITTLRKEISQMGDLNHRYPRKSRTLLTTQQVFNVSFRAVLLAPLAVGQ